MGRIRAILPGAVFSGVVVIRLLMVVVGVLEVASIYVLTLFGSIVGYPAAAKNSIIVRWTAGAFPSLAPYLNDERIIVFLAACLVVAFVAVKNIATACSSWYSSLFGERISRLVSNEIMSRYLRKPYIWHISGKGGETFQAMNFRSSLTGLIVNVLSLQSYLLITIFLVCIMFAASPLLTIAVYAVMGGTAYVTYNLIKKATTRAGEETATAVAAENSAVMNAIKGIREVLIYRQQKTFLNHIVEVSKTVSVPRARSTVLPLIPSFVLEAAGFGIMAGAVLLLIVFWNAELPAIVNMVFLLMLTSWRILPVLNRCVGLLVTIRATRPTAMICLNKLDELLMDDSAAEPGIAAGFSIKREIALKNVHFRYPSAAHDALTDVSCVIPKGGSVGFIGPSGAGKSTVSTMLCGLFRPSSGSFEIDGRELTPEELEAFRLKVGFVPQTPYLMGGTIADNVAFSEWGKPYDRQRVMAACEMAAMDFIHDLPKGVKTPLGEGGMGLSGGQAQRVAIARALYARPELIIFDEATSALDHMNEQLIKETIDRLRADITCVIIAHRLTTVESCDTIFLMERGRITASGAPSVILPRYARSGRKTKIESAG